MAYLNGQIPASELIPLSTGGTLVAPVAAAFEELRIRADRAGHVIALTSVGDAYRSLTRQILVFRERYTQNSNTSFVGPYGDVRWWDSNGNGIKERWVRVSGASAAVPGTSNHGWGRAVDISGTGGFSGRLYQWLAANGPALGWSNTEGRGEGESWHWVHPGAWVVSNPIGSGGAITIPTLPGAPAPISPEEDMPELAEIEAMTRGVVREQLLQVLRAPEFRLDAGSRKGQVEEVIQSTRLQHPVFGDAGQPLPAILADVFVHARAGASAPDGLDVEALADALAARLPKPDAEALLDALAARLGS